MEREFSIVKLMFNDHCPQDSLGSASPSLPLRKAAPTSCRKQPITCVYSEHVTTVDGRRVRAALRLRDGFSRRT